MRLCGAMRYFDAITASKLDDEEKMTLFVEFNEVVYRSVIDVTAHFIKEHCNDLKRIWKEWNEKYGLKKCSVWDCIKMERQYVSRWNEMEKTEKEKEEEIENESDQKEEDEDHKESGYGLYRFYE